LGLPDFSGTFLFPRALTFSGALHHEARPRSVAVPPVLRHMDVGVVMLKERIMTTTWLLAADGNQARLLKGVNFLKDGPQNPEQEIFQLDTKRAQDIMADKPGRSHSSVGHGRSAMEYSSDPVREEQERFTSDVASKLDTYARKGAFDRLVLCAAPQTLGYFRSILSAATRAKTTVEINKDYTGMPTDKLISSVRSAMSS
jgi:protein required for attachment to host cells